MNKEDIEALKSRHPIKEVALGLGLEIRGDCGKCFEHDDFHPSLVYLTKNNRFECKSCSIKGDVIDFVMKVKKINFNEAINYLEPTANIKKSELKLTGNEADEYLKSRGLSIDTLKKFNIRVENNKVVIPLSTGNKYRLFGNEAKFFQDRGTESTIFKTEVNSDEIILCEGELDAIKVFQETGHASWSCTGGAGTFKSEWLSHFEKIKKVFLCYDNDKAGKNGEETVSSVLGVDRCFKVCLPHYVKDATEFFQMGGTAKEFKELIVNSKPLKKSILDLLDINELSVFNVETGFDFIGDKVKFDSGNAYLIGGCEKSGKSAFCMNIAGNLLKTGEYVSYVNTEFTQTEFVSRMTGIYFDIPYSNTNEKQKREYLTKYQDKLLYSGIGQDEIESQPLLEKVRRDIDKGSRIIFFDNVTTFSNNPPPNRQGWEEQARVMNELKNIAKEKSVIVIVVLHTKSIPIERTLASKVKAIIESNDPSKIFDETIITMGKPTSGDLYGGLRIASQFSGIILIWRPFLKYSDPYFNQLTQIIFESFRNAPSGIAFQVNFRGDIPRFEIPSSDVAKELF